jgi:hypothetical protein
MPPARISRHLPDAKLIYIVRHPVERIESSIMQRLGDGTRTYKISRMLKDYPRLLDTCRYWKQIGFYRQFYSDEKIKVIFHEDMISNPKFVLGQLFEFLDVSTDFANELEVKRSNVSKGKKAPIPFIARMRKMYLVDSLKKYLPKEVYVLGRDAYHLIRDKSSVALSNRPVFDPISYEYIVSELSEDISKFLFHYGKPADFWDLSLLLRDR